MQEPLKILQKYWGFDSFRKKQDQIIDAIIDGKDVLALLPTGGGKSICYQVPGMLLEGTCLVISPLVALMQDQVIHLKSKGIKAEAITSSLSKRQEDILLDNAVYGGIKFLYVSPERLKNRLFLARLQKMNINLIAVDEAHCISQWGYDFRPAYLEIAKIRDLKPNTALIALTATATSDVVIDIQDKLNFKTHFCIRDSFLRENVKYKTELTSNKFNRLIEVLNQSKGSGIIYCNTRKEVKSLTNSLIKKGYSVNFYHGGLNHDLRKTRQQEWIDDKTQWIICTNAFGMGIDKPNVRNVIHFCIPETIEAYYQEAGRAGRDEDIAYTNMIFEAQDVKNLKQKVAKKYPAIDFIKTVYHALGNYYQLAIGSGKDEQFQLDTLAFCDRFNFDLIETFNALKFLELCGFIQLSENLSKSSQLKILVGNNELYNQQVKNADVNNVVQFICRTQMGVFENYVSIDEYKIAAHLKMALKRVKEVLNFLYESEIIDYVVKLNGSYVKYLSERLDINNVSISAELYHSRKKIALDKLNSMLSLISNESCTQAFLLRYFGEKNEFKCGSCVHCSENESNSSMEIQKLINYLNKRFKDNDFLEVESVIADHASFSKTVIFQALRELTDNKVISIDNFGKTIQKNV